MKAIVSVIMGSTSDLPVMKKATDFLNDMKVPFEVNALSAHRTPEAVEAFSKGAKERGVKIIGATSHYVTTELDAGPIIEQDVVRVTHKDTVKSFIHKGQDLEKIVLSRAVEEHIDRKVLVYKNRTVVFS